MANETIITVVGNAMHPEVRFLTSGKAVANFSIASTPRTFDRATSEWKDGETLWLNCSLFGPPAENFAASFPAGVKALAVIAQGRLKQRSYETQAGEKRTVIELEVDEIGPSLRFATAAVTKSSSGQQGGQQRQQSGYGQQAPGYGQPPQAPQQLAQQPDPWGQQAAAAPF